MISQLGWWSSVVLHAKATFITHSRPSFGVHVKICLYGDVTTSEMDAMATILTLKAPITTAADDTFCDIILNLKKGMIFHENCLQADNSHEIACLFCYC